MGEILVLFYNNDLEITFKDYEELKAYLDTVEGLTIKGITNLKDEQEQ